MRPNPRERSEYLPMPDIIAMIAGILPIQELISTAESLPLHQLLFFAILAAAIGLLVTERLRTDLVALLIIFVLGAGLKYTGLSETLGYWTGRLAGRSLGRMVAVLMPMSALGSAFSHHVTITALMLPTTLSLAKARQVPA